MGRWGTGRGLQPHCHALLCATFPLQSLLQGWMSAAQGLRPLQHIQEIPLCLQKACTLHGAEKKKKKSQLPNSSGIFQKLRELRNTPNLGPAADTFAQDISSSV